MLIRLLFLRLRGGFRYRLQELKTLRGLLFLVITISVVAFLMNQSVLPTNSLGQDLTADSGMLREQLTQFMPIALLAALLLTVFTSSGPAIHFNPAEINLLFSGPFSRHALLLYKMSFYAFGALLSSLLITLLIPTFTDTALAAFLGAFLTLMFIQLSSTAINSLGQLLGKYFTIRIRYSLLIILIVTFITFIIWFFANESNSFASTITHLQSSPITLWVLAPFDVFVHIFLAQSIFPDLLHWTTIGLVINISLLVVIIVLDKYSYEASIVASLKQHKRWKHIQNSGLFWTSQAVVVRSFKPPPVLYGIGPVAWRQLIAAFRSSSKALLVFLFLAILAGPLLVIASKDISIWSLIGGVFFAMVFVLPRTMVFDFRSDLNSMENFKALPLSPWKISAGQLVSPIILSSLIGLVLLVGITIFAEGESRIILFSIIPFLLPFNMLLYGLENLFFLLFPAPLVPVGRVDFDFLGRTMVGFAITATLLISGCGLAVYAGQIILDTMNLAWPAFVIVSWFSLTLIALLVLPLLSWAFNRFDVSVSNREV